MSPRRAPPPLPSLPVRIVLVRPRNPENVGAIARAMKNFGLSDWAWVAREPADLAPARRLAVHAEELLGSAKAHASLEPAIADCVWVVGTSSRRVRGKRHLSPRELASEVRERAPQGRTALVFGDERSGLDNSEIDRCHALSAIPTSTEQPSLNLAQAVLLYAYELRLAALDRAARPRAPEPPAATDAELARVEAALEELLVAGGFLVQPGRRALLDLSAPLRRSALLRREARLWEAALRGVSKRLRGRS